MRCPQALLANISSLYGVYHGPEGLKTIAARVNGLAAVLAEGAKKLGLQMHSKPFFDTVAINVSAWNVPVLHLCAHPPLSQPLHSPTLALCDTSLCDR